MKEIRLNKALYEDKSAAGPGAPAGAPAAPAPREPRASLFARLGALLVDLLLLHGVALAVARFAPGAVTPLHNIGPWVGFLVGLAYFAVGFGPLTGGRTVGKLVVRLRLADLSGPPLPQGRALLRAVLLLLPAGVYLATTQVDEAQFRPDTLEVYPRFGMVGLGLMLAWLIGNALFAMADTHGRSWYDHFVGCVNVTSDAPVEAQGEFVRDARENTDPLLLRRPRLYLAAALVTLVGLAGFWTHLNAKMLAEAPEDMKTVWVSRNRAFHVEGFLPPFKMRDEAASGDEDTSIVVYQYHARRPLTADALRAQPDVQTAVDRIADWFRESTVYLHKEQAREAAEAEAAGKPAPRVRPVFSDRFRVRTSFTEYADLFWGSSAHEVLGVTRIVDLADLATTATAPAQPPAPEETTATAAADAPTTGA